MIKSVNRRQLELDSRWFNYWHAHDWTCSETGYDDLGDHYREIGEIFAEVTRRMELKNIESQIWISINLEDPIQDAVYIHTENPHSEYPKRFDEYDWCSEPPEILMDLARGKRFGRVVFGDSTSFAILELPSNKTANK